MRLSLPVSIDNSSQLLVFGPIRSSRHRVRGVQLQGVNTGGLCTVVIRKHQSRPKSATAAEGGDIVVASSQVPGVDSSTAWERGLYAVDPSEVGGEYQYLSVVVSASAMQTYDGNANLIVETP